MSTSQNWRVAVIGAGTISQRVHIPLFQKQPDTTVVAVCDVNEARALAVAEETNVARVYSDYEKMLAELEPNIVVVATPNVFHKPMATAALEAGAHVLCEKPVALGLHRRPGDVCHGCRAGSCADRRHALPFHRTDAGRQDARRARLLRSHLRRAHCLAAAQWYPRLGQLVHQQATWPAAARCSISASTRWIARST